MATPRLKADVGLTLLILFLVTIITGVLLHLEKHDISVEPESFIRIVHWVAGLAMVAFACWHGMQFSKMLTALKNRFLWFWCDTWVVIVFLCLTAGSGLVKLLSPVRIHHLGLWHYWFGLVMAAAIILHLFRGLPSYRRLRSLH